MLKRLELRRLADTLLLGIAGTLSAALFTWLLSVSQHLFLGILAHYQPPGLGGEGAPAQQLIGRFGLWLVPLSTTLGGLLTGLIVFTLAPEAEGHGTDTVVDAFHHAAGVIRDRVPFLKMIASAITIGSGGSAGREGPTALITAGIGSIYASLTRRSEEDRRLLIVVGMAAGLSAIFRSPIGTAIFAIEVLYGSMEFESRALVYTTLASIVAYAGMGFFQGLHPLFQVPHNLVAPGYRGYLWYSLLGVACGVFGAVLPNVLYGVRDAFKSIRCPAQLKPAIGGLGVGLLALAWPQVLGGGYGWMQQAIDGKLAFELLASLLFVKILAFALTISSGGSGGVFAPCLFVGAMLGGSLAILCHQPMAAFVVVGMAALFGSAARVPVAALLMVMEMTGGFQLLIAAGLAVMLAFLVQRTLSPSFRYASLYEAQVPDRVKSPAHYRESLQSAFDLIGAKRIPQTANFGNLDMLALIESGIPVHLSEDKQLFLGTVRPGSPMIGHSIGSISNTTLKDKWHVLAILRKDETIAPQANTELQENDRLIVIGAPEVRNELAHLLVFETSVSEL